MNKGIVLGIDFSTDYTQLCILGDNNEPESIETKGIGDEYLIPSAMFYNASLKEWSIGIEAKNRSRVEEGIYIDKLPEKMNANDGIKINNEEIKWEKLATIYFERLFDYVKGKIRGKNIMNVVFSVDDPEEAIMQAIYGAMQDLGFEYKDIRVINHAESFAYYVLNQGKDVWINNVIMVDFSEQNVVMRKLFVTKGRDPHVVEVKKVDLSDQIEYAMLAKASTAIEADNALSKILKAEIDDSVVSAIFLNGQGFMKEGWYSKTIATICNNRRVFAGNNLIVKGAIYGAREIFFTKLLANYVIACKGRTQVNVYMNVVHRGTETRVNLSKSGMHWYEAGAKTQCILDKVDKAVFGMVWPATRKETIFEIGLEDFPVRDNKTVRVEVSLAYVDEHTIVIEIKDIGFGDFYESSGVVVRHEVNL